MRRFGERSDTCRHFGNIPQEFLDACPQNCDFDSKFLLSIARRDHLQGGSITEANESNAVGNCKVEREKSEHPLIAQPSQQRVSLFDVSERWLIDSGAGKHFVSREKLDKYADLIERVPAKTFVGAQGNFKVCEQMPIDFEGITFRHYVKSRVP